MFWVISFDNYFTPTFAYDVDESLKDKLKCLIFIPVISRTYCDPKSFAWENEFKEFVKQASHDRFGLKVKLPNGNVAGRVLPVRIHDLDAVDIKEYESVSGGILRGIEFIYKEPGVNRSLNAADDKDINHFPGYACISLLSFNSIMFA